MAEPHGRELAGRLREVALGMPLTADLSRSDLLLLQPMNAEQIVVAAQAQPNSISPVHAANLTGRILTSREAPVVFDAWRRRRRMHAQQELPGGATVVQDVQPIRDREGQVIGLLSAETSLIQLERHRQRHPSFQRAIGWLQEMCAAGDLAFTVGLTPFRETDGILLVDAQRRITYISGIATNLYRRLGYAEDLRGRRLSYLRTSDDELVAAAVEGRTALERELRERSLIVVRKVLPIWPVQDATGRLGRLAAGLTRRGNLGGAIIAVHDATAEHRKQEELQVKTTMIQEVHHRVKNNLQTIAAVLRMQMRRADDATTRHALSEAIARILSVAVIHEFLSLDESQTINVRDVCQRIVSQTQQVIVPGKQIRLSIEGPAVYLPSQQATACALVVNELIQNALEHGYENRSSGQIQVRLVDGGDSARLEICDDGTPLPESFDLNSPTSLGLQIVRTLVQGDLHGEVTLENQPQGVLATMTFPKTVAGGPAASGA